MGGSSSKYKMAVGRCVLFFGNYLSEPSLTNSSDINFSQPANPNLDWIALPNAKITPLKPEGFINAFALGTFVKFLNVIRDPPSLSQTHSKFKCCL